MVDSTGKQWVRTNKPSDHILIVASLHAKTETGPVNPKKHILTLYVDWKHELNMHL